MRKHRVFILTIYDPSDGQVDLCLKPKQGSTLSYMLGDILSALYTNTDVREISIRTEEVGEEK